MDRKIHLALAVVVVSLLCGVFISLRPRTASATEPSVVAEARPVPAPPAPMADRFYREKVDARLEELPAQF